MKKQYINPTVKSIILSTGNVLQSASNLKSNFSETPEDVDAMVREQSNTGWNIEW